MAFGQATQLPSSGGNNKSLAEDINVLAQRVFDFYVKRVELDEKYKKESDRMAQGVLKRQLDDVMEEGNALLLKVDNLPKPQQIEFWGKLLEKVSKSSNKEVREMTEKIQDALERLSQ